MLTPKVQEFFARAGQIFADRAKAYGTENIAQGGPSAVLARMRDKLARAETLLDEDSPDRTVDTALDLANYGIILAMLAADEWPRSPRTACLVRSAGRENIHLPQKPGDVGYDLLAAEDVVLRAATLSWVPTGVHILQPPGVWCRVAGRSSLLHKYGVVVPDNVIDNEYIGELKVPCFAAMGDHRIKCGDRVGQVVFFRAVCPSMSSVDVLPNTARGADGFGSTGR